MRAAGPHKEKAIEEKHHIIMVRYQHAPNPGHIPVLVAEVEGVGRTSDSYIMIHAAISTTIYNHPLKSITGITASERANGNVSSCANHGWWEQANRGRKNQKMARPPPAKTSGMALRIN